MEVEMMKYVPVTIPTLNRRTHLERLIESLKKNPEAEYTDLYISVDFPPEERYREGYEEVKQYVKTIDGFSQIHLYYQDHNLGPGFNRLFLMEQARKNSDTYVFTDDDNEFSQNSLAYINWALEEYKNDPEVYSVCCKADYLLPVKGDYVKTHAYCPYGAAYWFNKEDEFENYLTDSKVHEALFSNHTIDRINSVSNKMFCYLIGDLLREVPDMRGRTDNITYIDIWENIYCILEDKYNIMPSIPKTRNWGFDGSGVHLFEGFEPKSGTLFDESAIWPENPKNSDEDNMVAEREYFKFSKMPTRTLIRDYSVLFAYRHFSETAFEILKKTLTKNANHTHAVYYR